MTTAEPIQAIPRNATAVIVGAGDFIGAAIARKFAAKGYIVHMGRRQGEKLAPLQAEIEAAGGRAVAHTLDARDEDQIVEFFRQAEAHAPIEVCVFNIGANVNFGLLDTTSRVFRKVWEMACFSGFLTGREAIRHMLPRGHGSLFFTGATSSLRGKEGFSAFSSAKFALRAVAQSAAREFGPQGIHVAHLVIDAGVDTAWVRNIIRTRGGEEAIANLKPDDLMRPESVAEAYWALHTQARDGWTFEMDIRPYNQRHMD